MTILAGAPIRLATPSDAPAVATLLGQLGYPASADDAAARISRLRSFEADHVLVAELQGKVVGLATAHVLSTIHAPAPVAWITSLVVDTSARRSGVGAALVTALEAWARDTGASRITVTSGAHRADAHRFYAKLGYEQTGLRFARQLG